ncbi:MAG: hypothetical protein K2X66_14705 [Cyanobacteria bacterium]|nr:hypothetical protein [Cyanobacteriota bacterium]
MKKMAVLFVIVVAFTTVGKGFANCSVEESQKKLSVVASGLSKLSTDKKVPQEKLLRAWKQVNEAGSKIATDRNGACKIYDQVAKEFNLK